MTTYPSQLRDREAIVLVRPDGYVAWRGDGLDTESCHRFLGRFGLSDPGKIPAAV